MTRDRGINRLPVWSPGSTKLAFTVQGDDGEHVFWQAADASGAPQQLTDAPGFQGPMSFTPDGSRLLFITQVTEPNDVAMVSVGDTQSTEMLFDAEFSENNAEISPNGRWIAYQSDESGQREVYVRSFPDVSSRRIMISTGGGSRPLWSADGTELFYFVSPGAIMRVPVDAGNDFDAGSPELLFEGTYEPLNTGRHYDVSPDGRRFLILTETEVEDSQSNPSIVFVDNWFDDLEARVPVR